MTETEPDIAALAPRRQDRRLRRLVMIWLRKRGVSRYQPLLVGGVDRERSRSIRDAIKEGRPVEARDQAIAVELTQRTVQQRWIVYGTTFWLLFAW